MGSIGEAAHRLAGSVAAVGRRPEPERTAALEKLLVEDVHDPVVQATGARDDAPLDELGALADALGAALPVGAEAGLEPRHRVFVALLRARALEPAWTLAHDNGSGTVRQEVAFSTSSGAVRTSVRLPLVTLVEGERVYAWLPGFRDPRWNVPDEVYDITGDIEVRAALDQVRVEGGRMLLAGSAYLTQLPASADDTVAAVFTDAGGRRVQVPATRLRRPDLVKGTGPDLTQLAWSGWNAQVELGPVPDGEWALAVEVGHGEVRRTAPLGTERGPLAQPGRLPAGPHEIGGRVLRLSGARDGALTVQLRPLGVRARVVPRPVRAALRGVLGPR